MAQNGIAGANVQVGDVVSYEDMANPKRNYMVVKINDNPWSTFELVSVDGDFHKKITDGRQCGWNVEFRFDGMEQR